MIISTRKAGYPGGLRYFSGGYAFGASYGLVSDDVTLGDILDALNACCALMATNQALLVGKLDTLLGDSKIIKRIFSDQRNQSQILSNMEKQIRKVIERKK